MTRRALFSLAGLAGVPAVKAAEPATITVRHPIPQCMCGHHMMALPYDWETERRDARLIVCVNHNCEIAGKVCVQTLYEVVVLAERVPVPPRPDRVFQSDGTPAGVYGHVNYGLGFRVTKSMLP
jgi:hypothetical protein